MKRVYNYKGELLTPEREYLPADSVFFDDKGKPLWKKYVQSKDSGFDETYRFDNGTYIKRIVLPVGKKIVRYGGVFGRYTSDEGVDYDRLSLPYLKESMQYHEYIVSGHCEVECVVDKGFTAPGFGSDGGAVQYRHLFPIQKSLKIGILREDLTWLSKILLR